MKRPTGMKHRIALAIGLSFFVGNSLFLVRPNFCRSLRCLAIPTSKYDLAFRESLGFFDDIDEENWKRHQQSIRSDSLFLQPQQEDPKFEFKTALWMFNNVDPMFTCPHARRVGGRGDGPKWVCDPYRLQKRKDCLVYSVGSHGNYMFEDGLIEAIGDTHCEIHVFDFHVDLMRPNDPETKNMYVAAARRWDNRNRTTHDALRPHTF